MNSVIYIYIYIYIEREREREREREKPLFKSVKKEQQQICYAERIFDGYPPGKMDCIAELLLTS